MIQISLLKILNQKWKIKNLTKLEQIEKITESLLFSTISTSTIEVLVEISNYDLNNKSNYLAQLELEAKSQANDILNNGINNENLNGTKTEYCL
jgi:hypothetical protein